MRFVCDKCKTKYTISDEKIRGKVLKIRCKNCQNVIEVREPGAAQKVGAEPAGRPRTHGALKARSRHVGAAGRRRPARPALAVDTADRQPAEEPEAKTALAPMPQELLRDLRRSQQRQAEEEPIWHLGDDYGQYGPMPFSELAARVQRGEPGPNAEVWREGFDDWIPLREVRELQPHIKRAPPPRPPTGLRRAKAGPTLRDGDEPGLGAKPASAARHLAERRPQVAKVTPAARAVSDALVKVPSKPEPAARPLPAAPEAADEPVFAPGLPLEDDEVAAPVPAVIEPTPASSTADLENDFFRAPAHVSPAPASADLAPLLAEQKRARRPALFIGAGVLILSLSVIVLVVWLIFFQGKTPGKGGEKVAEAMGPAMSPGMSEAMQAAALERELPELDLDIDTVDVFSGLVITRSEGMRRRSMRATKPGESMARRTSTSSSSSSSSSYTSGLPSTMRSFSGIMGFDPSRSSSSSFSGAGGGRPPNLGNVVRRNYSRLKRCYERAARLDTRLKRARLRIRIQVSSSGRVRRVSISPARYRSDSLGICVRRSIMAWSFPRHGSDYTYTFGANFMGG